jgi:hypothetical protein
MKYLPTFALTFFVVSHSFAQAEHSAKHKRHVRFKTIGVDSVNISFNNEYYLIEDSCAQIVRYGHYNSANKKFSGKFKDISKADSDLIVSQGTYTHDGIKNGEFICYYLNGVLQSKGSFKNNQFDGKWELYYDDGKPQLTFDASGHEISIIDEWDTEGKKLVDKGRGEHISNIENYYWTGKIIDGKPDGTWRLLKASNASSPAEVTEYFKKGVFKIGMSPVGDYTDSSRIVFISPDMFPFLNAEKMHISREACDGSGHKIIVHAHDPDGKEDFLEKINFALKPFIKKINISRLSGQIYIEGEVNEKGALVNLHSTMPDVGAIGDITRNLILGLYDVPLLQPATVDNNPVTEKFSIIFTFVNGIYKIHYKFFPIKD